MSIHHVAKRARVSIATVSRTINGIQTVSPKIAERVWKAVRELGYYPNTQARALVSGRSRILGLIVSDIRNPFFPELIQGFEEIAVAHGYEVLLSSTNYDPARMAQCVRRMLERKADGVAIMTSEMEKSLITQLRTRNVPLAFLDNAPPGPRTISIKINYTSGIRQAIRHLIELGHRRIGFVSGPLRLKTAATRKRCFLRCLAECGGTVDPRLVLESDHTLEGGRDAVGKLLEGARPATAVLASNDLAAIGILAGLARAGLRVPRDFSVIGFDDIQFAQFTSPALTTVQLPRVELAQKAFHGLIFYLGAKKGETPENYRVETHLVIRESTGPARGQKKRSA